MSKKIAFVVGRTYVSHSNEIGLLVERNGDEVIFERLGGLYQEVMHVKTKDNGTYQIEYVGNLGKDNCTEAGAYVGGPMVKVKESGNFKIQ